MKLSGVTKMVKRQLVCNVFHNIKSDDFYIGTASAIYCATGFPLPLNAAVKAGNWLIGNLLDDIDCF